MGENYYVTDIDSIDGNLSVIYEIDELDDSEELGTT